MHTRISDHHPYCYQPAAPTNGPSQENAVASLASTIEAAWAADKAQPLCGHSEEEVRAREQQAWEDGFREGQQKTKDEMNRLLSEAQSPVAAALKEFGREREAYFQRIETEIVQLSLAIARKILHREAYVDPLLLAGVVRVALDKLGAETSVRLRLHPSHVQTWQDFFLRQTDLPVLPEILGDATLAPGECVLETSMGVAPLSLDLQLKEIEQGFFDLLAQRPGRT